MVVVALLSVDLVESVDLVSVELVVNCTLLILLKPALQLCLVPPRSWVSLKIGLFSTSEKYMSLYFSHVFHLGQSHSQN